MSIRFWRKHGWVAVVLVALLLGAAIGRADRFVTGRSKHREGAQAEKASPTRVDAGAERRGRERSDERGSDRKTGAAELVAADPLRSSLKNALTRFVALSTYRYEMKVRVFRDGASALQVDSRGHVKDQDTVIGSTEVGGQVVEVTARGARCRTRRIGEDWIEAGGGLEGVTGHIAPRAANVAQMWADPVLASIPLTRGPDEVVDGKPCHAIKMNLDGVLPPGGHVTAKGSTAVTFVVDSQGNLRRWRMEWSFLRDGRTLNALAETDFAGLDEPWTLPLPEWMR